MNQKIKFPIYVLSEEPEEIDGLVLIGDQVVDDKNMSGATIGMRRLQTPMKSIYPLRYQVDDEVGMMKHRGKHFIDTNGVEDEETFKIMYYNPPRNKSSLQDGLISANAFEKGDVEAKMKDKVRRRNAMTIEVQGAVVLTKQ